MVIFLPAAKLGAKTVERFLNLADENFVEDVNEDLKCFLAEKKVDSVLLFPPVSNYRRFLVHRCVESLGRADLATFSIGLGDQRRTVVCYRDRLLSDAACARPAMGLTQERGEAELADSETERQTNRQTDGRMDNGVLVIGSRFTLWRASGVPGGRGCGSRPAIAGESSTVDASALRSLRRLSVRTTGEAFEEPSLWICWPRYIVAELRLSFTRVLESLVWLEASALASFNPIGEDVLSSD
ncbi:jg1218 [Pararge aegeria aegeria]|uniref:Jg1218 protein n=1 Tax=Pararge aegeria aegeria TaxID=348720 RepID=A0A8S4R8B1_9NEOP|nr:jg1218 [Pararge aegeria aegeria]